VRSVRPYRRDRAIENGGYSATDDKKGGGQMSETPERVSPELVHEFVRTAHGGFDEVRGFLADEPELANAAWDWGGGDWETGLGAAAHMGRRDIAELLLGHGARLDVFAAAMLGETEIVKAIIGAFPAMREAKGPHGIPLIEHAKQGGAEARAVVELLEGAAV
jgi:hypothetical protein